MSPGWFEPANAHQRAGHGGYGQACIGTEGVKFQEGEGGVELLKLTVDQADSAGMRPFQPVTQTQFPDEFDGGSICTKKMMVEFLEPRIAYTKTGGQATGSRFLFKDHHRLTRACPAIGCSHPPT